jgi:hypothetical protein
LLGGLDDDVCEVGESKALRSEFVLGVCAVDDVDDPADEGLFPRCKALPGTDLNALRELYKDVDGFCGTEKEGRVIVGGGDGEDGSCLFFPTALGGLFRLTAFMSCSPSYSSTPSMLKRGESS